MNATDTRTKTALFCISPLVQGIATDLGSLDGFFPSDIVELALDILTSEVESTYTLDLLLDDPRCTATREAIREACHQTTLFHFLMKENSDEYYSELLARGATDSGTVFANRIVTGIRNDRGHMDAAVQRAILTTFDPAEFVKHSQLDLIMFFWKTFNISLNEIGQISLD